LTFLSVREVPARYAFVARTRGFSLSCDLVNICLFFIYCSSGFLLFQTPTVLTNSVNGQFYVIGNPAEVLSTNRAIAPRLVLTQSTPSPGFHIDYFQNLPSELEYLFPTLGSLHPKNIRFFTVNNGNFLDLPATRTDRRRATHNEVERRRRDNINTWIMKLGRLIPSEQESGPPKNTNLSKGGILARACDYILELKGGNSQKQCTRDVELENERLKRQVEELKQENLMLREQLGLGPKNQVRNQIFM
jgi:hypothetical protein